MTTELKNLYEDLIEGMIIEGINGMTPELKQMITDAPVEEKRSMILDILEENNPEHRLLVNAIQKLVKRDVIGEASHIKAVVKMLREYVKVSDVEVKKYGEIMTPIELVEEMLDTLPATVWMSPNLKWLDPCNGVGTFISVVVQRLMKGLEWTIPNEEDRYKHIMEEMIYVCELQAKNIFLYMYAFDPENKYAMNIYNGSFLSDGFNKHMSFLGVEKFDVIVMNPPYNTESSTGRGGTGHSLWDKFVIKTLDNLIENGYLIAVHPDGWRSHGDGTFRDVNMLLRSKQILYLEMHNTSDGFKTFGANTAYDFYCIHNVPYMVNTKVKTYDGKIERTDISKMEFIPNSNFKLIQNLMAKNNEERVTILHSESLYAHRKEYMSKEQTEEFKYPCVYTVGSLNPRFWYSSINTKGHFGIPKVIWGNGLSDVIIDENGIYGLTEYTYAIVDKPENLKHIQTALKSEKFKKEVMGYTKGVGHIYNRKLMATFRKDFWMDFI